MEGVKCSGCKWFNCLNVNDDSYGFCRSKRNIGLDSDCYEPEEKSVATTKIDYIRQEINDYVNSKTKEEIEEEINEIESVNEVGSEFVDPYKAGYDAYIDGDYIDNGNKIL